MHILFKARYKREEEPEPYPYSKQSAYQTHRVYPLTSCHPPTTSYHQHVDSRRRRSSGGRKIKQRNLFVVDSIANEEEEQDEEDRRDLGIKTAMLSFGCTSAVDKREWEFRASLH